MHSGYRRTQRRLRTAIDNFGRSVKIIKELKLLYLSPLGPTGTFTLLLCGRVVGLIMRLAVRVSASRSYFLTLKTKRCTKIVMVRSYKRYLDTSSRCANFCIHRSKSRSL